MFAPTRTGAAAGRRRFWVTVAIFAVLNVSAWFIYHRLARPRYDVLRVEQFVPGQNSVVNLRAALQWRFNLDVLPAINGLDPGTVTPAVSGHWQWKDARTLSFSPESELPKATRLTFTLAPERLRTAEGFVLPGPYSATVTTSPLALTGAAQVGIEDNDRYVIELRFNDRVLPADVAARLTLRDPDGKPLGFKLHGEALGPAVRVLTDTVPAPRGDQPGKILVRLAAGLAGLTGPLGLEQPREAQVILDKTLAITTAEGQSPAKGSPSIYLQVNGKLEPENAKQVLSVEPAVTFTVSSSYKGLKLDGDFRPGARYAVKIAATPAGSPRNKFPRPDTLSVLLPQREAGVWFEHEQGYLGSNGNRTLLAHAVNVPAVKLTLWQVYDSNLVPWRNAEGRYSWRDHLSPLSRPLVTKTLTLSRTKDQVQDLRLALDKMLPSGAARDGVYRVALEVPSNDAPSHARQDSEEENDVVRGAASAIVTLSDIGLTAKQSPHRVTIWAVSLANARPLQGIRIRAFSNKNQLIAEALTDADGLARLRDLHPAKGEKPAVILADVPPPTPTTQPTTVPADNHPPQTPTAPTSLTWLDLTASAWDLADTDISGRPYHRSGHEAFVYADRGVYRPGETVYLRAIVRKPDHGVPSPFPLRWQIRRPDLRDWQNQTIMLDADGAAGLTLNLPDDLPTGRWSAHVGLPGSAEFFGSVTFHVEEFMPERMKVIARIGDAQPVDRDAPRRIGIGENPIAIHVQADYLFGRPAAGLGTDLTARLDPARFAPAKWEGWTFGDAAKTLDIPGTSSVGEVEAHPADDADETDEAEKPDPKLKRIKQSQELQLNDAGHGKWELDLADVLKLRRQRSATEYHGPWALSVSASVKETGGRAVTAGDSLTVDALPWYFGIRPVTAGSAKPGEPAEFEIALVAPSGDTADVKATLSVQLFRETWNSSVIFRDGRYRYESHRKLEPVAGAGPGADRAEIKAGRACLSVVAPTSGAYVLRLSDPETGAVTSTAFYASNGLPWEDNISRENPERLELTVLPAGNENAGAATRPTTRPTSAKAQPMFRVGDSARVLVRSPFAGRLLLSIESDEVIDTRVIDMPSSSAEVPIDITAACRPNAYVTATVIRRVEPDLKWRTHRAFGVARIAIDPASEKLDIALTAPAEIRPHWPLEVKLRATDSLGQPAPNAAITLAAVDEGVLQVTRFPTPDPLAFFHARRALAVKSGDLYAQLMPEVPRPDKASAIGGDGDIGARHVSPVSNRRVKPVALVSHVLHTDQDGFATARLNVPEFTGKLRVMAVSYSGTQFGSADKSVLVRSPLLVQSSFPRFAAPGDGFTVPLAIFNNSGSAGDAKIRIELLDSTQPPATPLQFVTTTDRRLDLAEVHLPAGGQTNSTVDFLATQSIGVQRVRITATMGGEQFEENIEIPVRPASPSITRGGVAAVNVTSPTRLEIPRDLLPGTDRLEIKVTPWPTLQLPEGLDYLERYPYGCAEQTISTSFPLIYLSDIGPRIAPGVFEKQRVAEKLQAGILRLMAMQTADGGLAMWPGSSQSWPWASVYGAHLIVEAERAGHAVPEDFRKRLLDHLRSMLDRLADGDALEQQAYACYVLALAGKPERSAMSRLSELANSPAPPEHASQQTRARLHLSLAWLASGRRDLAQGLIPQTLPLPRKDRQLGGNVGSPVRDRALLLSALLEVQPNHPGLPRLVQQLADAGRQRQWRSTQDCAFATMAIGRYLRQAKPHQPYDRAELTDAGTTLAQAESGDSLAWTRAGAAPPKTRPIDEFFVRITGVDDASAYVSWLQSGVPLAPPPDADNSMKLRRRYLDKSGQPLANIVRSGDKVQVELSIEAPSTLDNVVIEDLLPAGLEIENPRLPSADTADPSGDAKTPHFEVTRLDVRDDRLVIVGKIPERAGTVTYRYFARAVAPGTFIVPPARAECMYDLSINSLSGGGATLTVKPANDNANRYAGEHP